jgi:beta-lactamase class A
MHLRKSLFIGVVAFVLLPMIAIAQVDSLRSPIATISQAAGGKIGVAVLGLESGDTFSQNGTGHFVMQSVFKFPLAFYVLHLVDSGKLSLDSMIHVTRRDLPEDTYSPLRDKYPKRNINISIRDLLSYSVSQSDNNATDILFRVIKGPIKVQNYIRSLGIKDIAIVRTEAEMHGPWSVQFQNWCEPVAMIALLKVFFERKYLSPQSSDLLWKLMTETTTGERRIKGLLPEGTSVAHKTGTSGSNGKGLYAALNDVGIVTLPNGKHFAIVVYVSMSKLDIDARETVIAKIAKAVWDYYVNAH